ncbi:MAG: 2'-5' RNA ligase family protein [Candidatus Lokiarchaeota archaeon]|nr:2'-5' RNA ligase family protein [Candidatus Lokiarchaeota archaeon]
MSKVVTSACVIIPPREKWEPIQKIRRRHDRKIDRWMPHINLLYPFAPEEKYETVESEIRKILESIEPFELTLKRFKYFRHRYQTYTIWLDPEPNEKVAHLQRQTLRAVPECNDVNQFRGGFQPHLSVGQFTTYKINKKLKKLKKNWEPLTFLVDKIYFISRKNRKDSAFEVSMSISL